MGETINAISQNHRSTEAQCWQLHSKNANKESSFTRQMYLKVSPCTELVSKDL